MVNIWININTVSLTSLNIGMKFRAKIACQVFQCMQVFNMKSYYTNDPGDSQRELCGPAKGFFILKQYNINSKQIVIGDLDSAVLQTQTRPDNNT